MRASISSLFHITSRVALLSWALCQPVLAEATIVGNAPDEVPWAIPSTGITTRVSVARNGIQANDNCVQSSISATGRYITFASGSRTLVWGDTNGSADIFVHDQETGHTTRVSVASNGDQANNNSYLSSISATGRFVAFSSDAWNLVSGDTNGWADIFVHDRQTGQTSRVSIASDGNQAESVSNEPSISATGRYVAFFSEAANLVSGDTNGYSDVFVHDRETGLTTRVSVASDGSQGDFPSEEPSISATGRFVAFFSEATNLVSGDTNNTRDIFVHDRQTGETSRISVASDGAQAIGGGSDSPSISATGRFITFTSVASNLVSGDTNDELDVFVHDRESGETTRVSIASNGTQANGGSSSSSISATGRYVTFASGASNLVSGDSNGLVDIFVHDRQTGETTRVSIASNGTQSNGDTLRSSISATGRYVTFESIAANLVLGDTNNRYDVFLHDRQGGVSVEESLPIELFVDAAEH